ncbi:hypothetical protein ASZ90_001417 [hydrocarbon metagenome]|uniref:Uncharacterized protein n=1 Tax=hydrocarbon metagenome TaxID=938273 RepID=A0A0W8G6T6_9ZZZZ
MFLARPGPGGIVGQGGQGRGFAGFRGQGRGFEAHKLRKGLAVQVVPVAELHDPAVLAPEVGVFFRVVLGQLSQAVEHLLGDGGGDLAQDAVLLEGLPGDVERQVFGIHHAAHEPQEFGEKVFGLVLDEHPAYVEIQAPGLGAHAEEVRGLFGDEKQGAELHRGIDGDVDGQERLFAVEGQKFVEFLVLLGRDRELGLAPQGRDGVDLLLAHDDRKGDEVGMLAQDGLDAFGVGEFLGLVLQVDLDAGAPGDRVRGFGQAIGAGTVGLPAHGGRVGKQGLRGQDHVFGHHEHGIKTHPEAADDARGGVLVVGELFEELCGPGTGDGADVLDEFVPGHAQARVGDGQDARVLVGGDADLKRQFGVGHGRAATGLEAQLVQGVGGVGHELAQKDLAVGVDGVGDDLQQLAYLGLELMGGTRSGVRHGALLCVDRVVYPPNGREASRRTGVRSTRLRKIRRRRIPRSGFRSGAGWPARGARPRWRTGRGCRRHGRSGDRPGQCRCERTPVPRNGCRRRDRRIRTGARRSSGKCFCGNQVSRRAMMSRPGEPARGR